MLSFRCNYHDHKTCLGYFFCCCCCCFFVQSILFSNITCKVFIYIISKHWDYESLFFLSTSRNSREFVLDSPLATRWFLSAFVLFCFVSRLVGCFFFGLLPEAIEVRTLNSIKGSTYTGECHSKYLMNGWCCKYLVSAKEQEYRNLNILYNIYAYLPAD